MLSKKEQRSTTEKNCEKKNWIDQMSSFKKNSRIRSDFSVFLRVDLISIYLQFHGPLLDIYILWLVCGSLYNIFSGKSRYSGPLSLFRGCLISFTNEHFVARLILGSLPMTVHSATETFVAISGHISIQGLTGFQNLTDL